MIILKELFSNADCSYMPWIGHLKSNRYQNVKVFHWLYIGEWDAGQQADLDNSRKNTPIRAMLSFTKFWALFGRINTKIQPINTCCAFLLFLIRKKYLILLSHPQIKVCMCSDTFDTHLFLWKVIYPDPGLWLICSWDFPAVSAVEHISIQSPGYFYRASFQTWHVITCTPHISVLPSPVRDQWVHTLLCLLPSRFLWKASSLVSQCH